ncbi:MAG TPA: sigma 54-interacting transcriptional regulator [Kofleriaceae bacterium]|nr:sigma 54-interacting transcriptional regulator [Kofleriaceae bacterium]
MSDEDHRTRSEVKRCRHEPLPRSHAWLVHVVSCETPMTGDAAAYPLDDVDLVVLGRGPRAAVTQVDGDRRCLHLGFPDQWMSIRHARIERRVGAFWLVDDRSKNGLRVNGRANEEALLVDGDWIEVGHTVLRYRHGALPPPRQRRGARSDVAVLPTTLPSLEDQVRDLEDIARSSVSVVLQGETGTGKEVVARAVHRVSGRRGELIAVNCGALPATLLESELFGYRRGSFSNALEDRPGLVRAADGGTLFLDEIGDLPPASQAALLRVLQEHEVTPLGATRPVKVDLRVVCATHHDLDALVARGEFRTDLYARLVGHRFVLPPLRERREDLGLLTAAILRRDATDGDVLFAPEAMRALYRYHWPLNVRELEKCLGAALVLARGAAIDLEHLPAAIAASPGDGDAHGGLGPRGAASAMPPAVPGPSSREHHAVVERQQILDALARCGGNQSRAAKLLGMPRNTLIAKIERYGLARPLTPRRQRPPN